MISRRVFLKQSWGLALGASAVDPVLNWAADAVSIQVKGKEGMIVRSARFLDLEMPPEFLNSWITPIPHFFVRNHMHEPSVLDADQWKLSINGEVDHPMSLTLVDLARMEPHAVTNTLECAGNGRAFHQPHVPGVQWRRGAVGTAHFTRPRFGEHLQRAGEENTSPPVGF